MNWAVVAAIASPILSAIIGGLAYWKIPKRDLAASKLTSVQAADLAMDMLEESYKRKVDDLLERVIRLETQLGEAEARIEGLTRENNRLMRWSAILAEQVAQRGGIPYTLEEVERLDR